MSKYKLFDENEEAIKILKEEKKFVDKHGSYYGDIKYFELAISALKKQQEFHKYMEYMKQLSKDETKPSEDRQFASKFIVCCEEFILEVEE